MSSELNQTKPYTVSLKDSLAIDVTALSKCFHIYDLPRHRLQQLIFAPIFNKNLKLYKEFWALRDISFKIYRGETIGIIGKNGSGKSTLLQIICGTLTPTSGRVETNGRVAALLELGSGFNPEFTGRENIYLNGAVLGLSKEEIDQRFEAIVHFADIGDFIEQPVKSYSSGMSVRLAFAVAINADPEILVIDEALSVGDELFQRKCFSRIEQIKKNGATILFVSHSGGTVIELCDRAILIDSGQLLIDAAPKEVVGKYQKLLYASPQNREEIRNSILNGSIDSSKNKNSQNKKTEKLKLDEFHQNETFDASLVPSSTIAYEEKGACIEAPRIETLDGKKVNNIIRGKNYFYKYTVSFSEPAFLVRFGMLIKSLSGIELGGAISASKTSEGIPYVAAGQKIIVQFKFTCALNPGLYFLNAGVQGTRDGAETYLHRLLDVATFRVQPEENLLATSLVDFSCEPNFEISGVDNI
ncbi:MULTISPECIES: ABC transporter ATP-binding protein [unclassified Pseudomonas]|uniref:ABC transporter ATP-binding protein n=1 Tax=Pseudomonas TaxID=286 RepID=UPI002579A6F9|nr:MULTISPECIES: ABC transporter ATP-binding protein [unclassified Pseudomonas]